MSAPVSSRAMQRRPVSGQGFTLVELIVVIVVVGILGVTVARFIAGPVEGYFDLSRRAALVDIAENALQRMSREIRHALPNSVRIRSSAGRVGLEFLHTVVGGRYRAYLEADGSGDVLDGTTHTDTFDALGGLPNWLITTGTGGQADCLMANAHCLVIYNTGTATADYNAYAGDNIATLSAFDSVASTLTFQNDPGWNFPFAIPATTQQRFFIVDTPVSFVCDTTTDALLRFDGYAIQPSQPLADAAFAGAGRLLADQVASCDFSYQPGAAQRHGLVTLRVTLRDASGEQIALLHQVHVVNSP